ncbi:MAG: hypothetical protein V1709_00760 [Planctomycetota bacterium]
MSFSSWLTDTVTVKKPTHSVDVNNQIVESETSVTGVKARIEPLTGGRDRTVLGKFPSATHKMFCEVGVDIDAGYQVLDANSITYEVNYVAKYFSHHKEVILEQKEI